MKINTQSPHVCPRQFSSETHSTNFAVLQFFFISKTINSLFFLVFAMAEHENRQKFVTSYEGQLGRILCMVVCLQKQTEMQKFCCSFITRFCFVFLTTHSVVGGYRSLTIALFFQLNQRTKLSGFWPI